MSTIYEWKMKYDENYSEESYISKDKAQKKVITTISDDATRKIEHVSPYFVRNRVGYPITVTVCGNGYSVDLLDDETKTISFENSIDELFSANVREDPFSNHRTYLTVHYKDSVLPRSEPVVINRIGVVDVPYESKKGPKSRLYCDIRVQDKKRYITFTSSVQVTNELNIALEVSSLLLHSRNNLC